MRKKIFQKSSRRIETKLSNTLSNAGDMALKRRAGKIVTALNLKEGDKVLDAGCGDGYFLFLLSNLGLKIKLTGIDNDNNALISAKERIGNKKIKLMHADLQKGLPFEDNVFNKLILSEVAEHLTDDLKGLKEAYRVLKPGGLICITVPNADFPFLWDPLNWMLEKLFNKHIGNGFWAGIWNQHIRLYKKENLERLIKRAGFEILESSAYTWWSLPFNHYLVNLAARLINRKGVSKNLTMALSKFNERRFKKQIFVEYLFKFINLNDKINDVFSFDNIGVGIFIKASKTEGEDK